jgi:hypothetical protein
MNLQQKIRSIKMNKYSFLPFVMGMLLCACSSEENLVDDDDDDSAEEVDLEAQWADSSATRTTMTANDNVCWNSKDAINCNGKASKKTVVQYQVGNDQYTKALFTVAAKSPYYAMYPSKIGGKNAVKYKAGTFTFTFPYEQPYNNDVSFSKDYNPSTAYSKGTRVYFYNSCGIVKATISGNFTKVRKIRFVSANSAVSGNAKVVVPTTDKQGGSMKITDAYKEGKNDYMDATFSADKDLSKTSVTVYWILPPADYVSPTIELLDANNRLLGEKTAAGTVTVKRSVITNLKTLTPDVAEAYPIWEDAQGLVSHIKYITTSGSGVIPSGYTDLSQVDFLGNKGLANCYVVPAGNKNTKWCIPAEKIGGTWVSEKENTYICFTVKPGVYGNALLGYSAANVPNSQTSRHSSTSYAAKTWSWHIWVPKVAPKEETLNGYTELDMSLGAIDKNSTQTTLYEWGRKDPFANQDDIYANEDGQQVKESITKNASGGNATSSNYIVEGRTKNSNYANQNPDIYFRGKKSSWCTVNDDTRGGYSSETNAYIKTVNDPCPIGYQVTYKTAIWEDKISLAITSSETTNGNGDILFGSAFFPYCQHLRAEDGYNAECKLGHVWTAIPRTENNSWKSSTLHNYSTADGNEAKSAIELDFRAMGFSVRPMKSNQ